MIKNQQPGVKSVKCVKVDKVGYVFWKNKRKKLGNKYEIDYYILLDK